MDFPGAGEFTTGPSTIPDVGELSYNGCLFSPLFATTCNGVAVKDNAKRTVMYMEYTITADGYATCPNTAFITGEPGMFTTPPELQTAFAATITTLRKLLTQQAGDLTYRGRGCEIVVNAATSDVVWGPVPELLEFQPLGGGLSAKVRWQVKVRIPEVSANSYGLNTAGGPNGGNIYSLNTQGGGYSLNTQGSGGYSLNTQGGGGGFELNTPSAKRPGATITREGLASMSLLQFNYETSVTYDDAGFSTLGAKGTLEIPLTRSTQSDRNVPYTVDNLRGYLDGAVFAGVDLSLFRVTRRNFTVSRDKRVLEWDFQAEEKPYMDLPPYCTIARGMYSVRPATAGMGLVKWLCNLKATYTVRADQPRRVAWFAFLALLRLRMNDSKHSPNIDPKKGVNNKRGNINVSPIPLAFGALGLAYYTYKVVLAQQNATTKKYGKGGQKAFLINLSFDEGIYLDSKTTTFSATWRLTVPLSHILLASGLWDKVSENYVTGANVWATSMADAMGSQSWMANLTSPDIIVDFGSGA